MLDINAETDYVRRAEDAICSDLSSPPTELQIPRNSNQNPSRLCAEQNITKLYTKTSEKYLENCEIHCSVLINFPNTVVTSRFHYWGKLGVRYMKPLCTLFATFYELIIISKKRG